MEELKKVEFESPPAGRPIGRRRAERKGRPSLSELISLQLQTERSDLDLQDLLLGIYFVRLGTLLERVYDRYCQQAHGISGGDMGVLLALRRTGKPYAKRPTDLFRTLLVTSGAITKKVDRLVEAGCVERLPDPSHNGGFLVHLTKHGLQMVDRALDYLATNSVLTPAMSQLSPEDRKRISAVVLGVLTTVERAESA